MFKRKELAEIPNVKPIAAETKKQRAKEEKQRSKQLRRSAKQSEMNAAQSARSIKKCRAPEKAADCLQYERIFFCLLYLYAVHLKPNCCVACFNCVRFTPSLPMCTTCPTSTISTSNP